MVHTNFILRTIELGASNARIINTSSIITSPWVRLKCQYGCRRYNTNLCCPPFTPSFSDMKNIISSYSIALLVHCNDSSDPKKICIELEREIFLDGYHKAFCLGAGPCDLCNECNRELCINPTKSRPSMEACGIDVFATARANGFPIEVLKNRSCEQNYFGLILIE